MAKWHLTFLLLTSSIYLANRFLLKIWDPDAHAIPYLNDILCIPIVLTIALFFQQQIVFRNFNYRLTKFQVAFTVCYFAFIFEGVLPWFANRYTADILDVVAYVAGGIIYYLGINPKTTNASGDAEAIS